MAMQMSFPRGGCNIVASKRTSSKVVVGQGLPLTNRKGENKVEWKKMTCEKQEIFKSLEGWAEKNILTLLKPIEEIWQPQDFLPDPSARDEEFFARVKEIRECAGGIPDEYYVCLVGNMINEESLPTYQTWLNTLDGIADETGMSPTSWARWTRSWAAEENRHGNLLSKYLYLSGRVDMRQVQKSVQYMNAAGINTGADGNPYCGFVYASFQERATFSSHGNTARLAKGYGDIALAKVCGIIASDEKRHEFAYTKIVEKLFEVDPDTMMLALADIMRKRIAMPALYMEDGQDRNLYAHYSAVAENMGIYTVKDYADNLEYFVKRWKVEEVGSGLSDEGREAQEYVCRLIDRFRMMEERVRERRKGKGYSYGVLPFSWIFNRNIVV